MLSDSDDDDDDDDDSNGVGESAGGAGGMPPNATTQSPSTALSAPRPTSRPLRPLPSSALDPADEAGLLGALRAYFGFDSFRPGQLYVLCCMMHTCYKCMPTDRVTLTDDLIYDVMFLTPFEFLS